MDRLFCGKARESDGAGCYGGSLIPSSLCFLSPIDEIGEYIRSSFESCTDQDEKETSMELLRMMIQEETMWEI